MPPRVPRTIGNEATLARRIRWERENRGWTPASLAHRMTQLGCPMNQSAIWKIENNDPPRRITVDELVAFARVFAVDNVDEMLLAPEVVGDKMIVELLQKLRALTEQRMNVLGDLVEHIKKHPGAEEALEQHMTEEDRVAVVSIGREGLDLTRAKNKGRTVEATLITERQQCGSDG